MLESLNEKMRIFYPYNEILPKKKAHDAFIFKECAALAQAGCDVTLLIGAGSYKKEALFSHYGIENPQRLKISTLPLIRKNNFLNLSWNRPFFALTQEQIARHSPDWVILSVRKQAHYHFTRKQKNVKYLYEVHELTSYGSKGALLEEEREMLQRADQIVVTTQKLKELLLQPPYAIKRKIAVIPLAASPATLPALQLQEPCTLMYVGQLYQEQGIDLLFDALQKIKEVRLFIIGGKRGEIERLKMSAQSKGIAGRLFFFGFLPPKKIAEIAALATGFVAPFTNSGRMPYVAHTKLYEYAAWGRPFIVPDLPVVREDFTPDQGIVFFEPNSSNSLAEKIDFLKKEKEKLQLLANQNVFKFTWQRRVEHYLRLLIN
jgi:glycosyltransferase involved in cell wall biosynthesis